MLGRIFRSINHRADELLVAVMVFVFAAVVYAPSLMPMLSNGDFLPVGAESSSVKEHINQKFGAHNPSLIVIMKGKEPAASDQSKAAVHIVADQVRRDKTVRTVITYYDTHSPELLAKDGKGVLALVTMTGSESEREAAAGRLRDTVKHEALDIKYFGESIVNHDITAQINKDLAQAEAVSFALLAILLVIVFRGVVAALVPLLLGACTILISLLVLRALAEVMTIVEYALNVIILIGLGLAVDYSLLMVSRFREELVAQKNDISEALRVTMQTAGRTILFSGLTVIISLLSLLVFPLDFLRSMGIGGAVAVAVAMGGALIALPSLLRVLGRRINWLSFGRAKRLDTAARAGKAHAETRSLWYKTGALFMKRPFMTSVITLVVLVAAGIPFLRAHFATPDYTVLPASSLSHQAAVQLERDFGFSSSPIKVVYATNGPNVTAPPASQTFAAYRAELERIPGVQRAGLAAEPEGQTALLDVTFSGSALSPEARQLVERIRATPSPQASVTVGGDTAQLVDLLTMLKTYLPWGLVIIALALFVLLFLMLGSVILPVVAMVQTSLSLCASFGALVWVFQDGHFADALHMNVIGNIDATQPVLIFAVAFGLSMDYSVFLYGRIKEEYDRTGDAEGAVLHGLQKTGGIITSAALLLFVVVAAFAASKISIMQQIGVGLGLAILVDAFVIRMVLVPATMKLLGRFAWYAPPFLRRIHTRIGMHD